jgi:hypothetical protein
LGKNFSKKRKKNVSFSPLSVAIMMRDRVQRVFCDAVCSQDISVVRDLINNEKISPDRLLRTLNTFPDHGALRRKHTCLSWSCYRGLLDLVELLLNEGADMNYGEGVALKDCLKEDSETEEGLILRGTEEHRLAVFAYLLEREEVNLKSCDEHGRTILHHSISCVEALVMLLRSHRVGRLDVFNRAGWTPLMMAVQQQEALAMRLLVAEGADLYLPSRNLSAKTAFQMAQTSSSPAVRQHVRSISFSFLFSFFSSNFNSGFSDSYYS